MRGALSSVREFAIESKSPEETFRLGAALGRLAEPGLVVALKGPLGAGKTMFARGVAEGAGANPLGVTSPTFVLIQEYPGRIPIFHFDAYRLTKDLDFEDLGVEEYFYGEGVCLVEWADRVERLLPLERIEVTFVLSGPQSRRIEATCMGTEHSGLMEHWQAASR